MMQRLGVRGQTISSSRLKFISIWGFMKKKQLPAQQAIPHSQKAEHIMNRLQISSRLIIKHSVAHALICDQSNAVENRSALNRNPLGLCLGRYSTFREAVAKKGKCPSQIISLLECVKT